MQFIFRYRLVVINIYGTVVILYQLKHVTLSKTKVSLIIRALSYELVVAPSLSNISFWNVLNFRIYEEITLQLHL